MATMAKQNKKATSKKATTPKAKATKKATTPTPSKRFGTFEQRAKAFDALLASAAVLAMLEVKHEESKTGTRRAQAWKGKTLAVLANGQLANPIRVTGGARPVVDCRSVASVPAMGAKAIAAVLAYCGNVAPRTLPSGCTVPQCFSYYTGRIVVPTIADSGYIGALLLAMSERKGDALYRGAQRIAADMLAMLEACESEKTQPGTGIAYLTVSK
jgi:hypothetical protein